MARALLRHAAVRSNRGGIVTSVSCLLAIACTTQHKATSLAGAIACGTTTCGDGQLCTTTPTQPPDGTISYQCLDVPKGCDAYDCRSSDPHTTRPGCTPCETCIMQLCAYYPDDQNISLAGRMLSCPSF
jgi:hypothetical protein